MAISMGLRYPQRVRSLVLIGGFSEIDTIIERNFWLRIAMIDKLGMSDELGAFVSMWIMSHRFLDTDLGKRTAQATVDNIRTNDPETYKSLCRSVLRWGRRLPGQEAELTITSQLASLSMPVLALTGTSDHFIPATFSRLIADRVPNGQYQEIADCGHIPVLEKPAETVAAIQSYLSSRVIA